MGDYKNINSNTILHYNLNNNDITFALNNINSSNNIICIVPYFKKKIWKTISDKMDKKCEIYTYNKISRLIHLEMSKIYYKNKKHKSKYNNKNKSKYNNKSDKSNNDESNKSNEFNNSNKSNYNEFNNSNKSNYNKFNYNKFNYNNENKSNKKYNIKKKTSSENKNTNLNIDKINNKDIKIFKSKNIIIDCVHYFNNDDIIFKKIYKALYNSNKNILLTRKNIIDIHKNIFI